MNLNESKALALATLFSLLFSVFFGFYLSGGDFGFHLGKAANGCSEGDASCQIYAPLFSIVAQPFSFHENALHYFAIILIGFITPLLLFLIAKDWLVVWLFYSTTNYFYFIADGLLAQGLAMVLFLVILAFDDWRIEIIALLLSIMAHGHGFYLAALALTFKYLWFVFKKDVKKISLCSGLFGAQQVAALDQPVKGLVSTGQDYTVSELLMPFTKIFPFPLSIVAIWHSVKHKKELHLVGLAFAALAAGVLMSHRIFYVIPLVLLPGLTWWANTLKPKQRHVFLAITVILFAFQLYNFLNFKKCIINL